jgi:hypothetical protein
MGGWEAGSGLYFLQILTVGRSRCQSRMHGEATASVCAKRRFNGYRRFKVQCSKVQRLSAVQGSRVQKFNVPAPPQASYKRITNTITNHEHVLGNSRNFEMRNRIARQSRRGNAPARSSGLPQGADGHGVKLIAETYAHLAIVQHQASCKSFARRLFELSQAAEVGGGNRG